MSTCTVTNVANATVAATATITVVAGTEPAGGSGLTTPTPRGSSEVRVRDRVRDGLAVIAFSAVTSVGLAATFGLLISVLGS
jgi:hypothetical protein